MKPRWGAVLIVSVLSAAATALEISGKEADGIWALVVIAVLFLDFDGKTDSGGE